MNTVQTSRQIAAPSTAVFARLAERWHPAGLYLACFGRDGSLLWHDNRMPRLLALAVTGWPTLAAQIRELPDTLEPCQPIELSLFAGVELHLVPIARRRKVAGWIAIIARVDTVAPQEDIHRLASRAAMDVQSMLAEAARAPLVAGPQLRALATVVGQMHEDLHGGGMVHQELSSVTEQLSGVYEEISLLYKISSGMRFSQKPQAFLQEVCREVQEIGNFRAVLVALARRDDDAAAPTLGEVAVQVGTCGVPGHALVRTLSTPIHEALRLGEPQVHNHIPVGAEWHSLAAVVQRFVCVPLMRDKRTLGVMLALDKNDQSEFTSVDTKLLGNVASQCSIFMENANLYQDMQDLFMGVLHALTRSIDAKDAYTRGHSQRVAELSRTLAQKIGLPEEQCERVYLSGLLHDVGKIGVPEAVLTKPGRLTDAEFEAIKKHPAIGAQILGNIKQLQDIIPGVLYHHERWDGNGYPYNLAREAIPLMGRIICVADSFDAMSSTRTYRPALPLETVLAEVARCAGAQFDPALAKVFVGLDFTAYRDAIEAQISATRQAESSEVRP